MADADKPDYFARLRVLRAEIARAGLDGFVVPLTDEHRSEYVGDYAKRLEWLTGFKGSAGSAVVLANAAAVFVDGRYTLQVRAQVDNSCWTYESVPETSPAAWLRQHAPVGARIGYDPWLHTLAEVARLRDDFDGEIVPSKNNPIDAVWADRPAPSSNSLTVHSDALAGRSGADKRAEIADWLAREGLDATVMTALDSVAWTFNLRGTDVAHTPVGLAFALVNADGTADLFVDPEKIDDAVRAHLGNAVRLHARGAFASHLAALRGKRIGLDPERAVAALYDALVEGGAEVVEVRDPAVLAKAIKNPTEISGHRSAQLRDGAALTRFLHWLSNEGPRGQLTETAAADRLHAFRNATGKLRDLSFDTIAGAGPNGAVIHYRAEPGRDRRIEPGSLFLCDSGGQYDDGTTDVTRTIWIGPGSPLPELRDRFTRVLKGHIAIATAIFPQGTRGGQLDTLARAALWQAGLDYAHGTGHGVGSFLSVHEGPQRIARPSGGQTGGDEPLVAGMFLSNEPGYYKDGAYGIRIENLVLVGPRVIAGAEHDMLGFETLTFAPIDRQLIDAAVLTTDDRSWLNAYHAMVNSRIGVQLEGEARAWLEAACAPI